MFGYLSADITIEAKDGIGFCFMETKGGAFSMEMKKVNGRIRFIQKALREVHDLLVTGI